MDKCYRRFVVVLMIQYYSYYYCSCTTFKFCRTYSRLLLYDHFNTTINTMILLYTVIQTAAIVVVYFCHPSENCTSRAADHFDHVHFTYIFIGLTNEHTKKEIYEHYYHTVVVS